MDQSSMESGRNEGLYQEVLEEVSTTSTINNLRRLGDATIGSLATLLGLTFWNYLKEQPQDETDKNSCSRLECGMSTVFIFKC